MRARLLWIAVLAACGSGYPAAQAPGPNHRGIEAAALPFSVLDAKTGHQVETSAFWDKLASERAVCVGEEHKNPHHHWVELEVVRHLAKRWPHFALGLEMFQRPFQGVLDDFASKKIDETTLRSRSGWDDRWGFDFGFYGPTIAVAVEAHAALLALNAAKEVTHKVAMKGLEALTPEERAQLPVEILLTDKKHRAWFDALMEDMGGGDAHSPHGAPHDDKPGSGTGSGSGSTPEVAEMTEMPTADHIYAVQVIWDETMADGAAKWLAANKDGHVVILAGSGHCHDSGIVSRMKRRGITDVVSVRSVIDDGQGGVAEELAKPNTDFLVVLDLPEDVKKQMAEHKDDKDDKAE
ncbi:MAG: ChaN family lipoprotein [Kofleriaceae bacterium]